MRALRNRFSLPLQAILLALIASTATPLHADTGVLAIQTRDRLTHMAVTANVMLKGAQSFSAVTDDAGTLRLQVPAGVYEVTISAPGYKPMSSREDLAQKGEISHAVMLTPLESPPELRSLGSQVKTGDMLLLGYASDAHGHPVPGVRVHVERAKLDVYTNARGFYSMLIPTTPTSDLQHPQTDTVVAAKAGFKTIIHRHVLLRDGQYSAISMEMVRGTGEDNLDDLACAQPSAGCRVDEP
jgi:hypothetical protein